MFCLLNSLCRFYTAFKVLVQIIIMEPPEVITPKELKYHAEILISKIFIRKFDLNIIQKII